MSHLPRAIGLIVLALLAGALLGLLVPGAGPQVAPLAKWVLQLIKAAATPLVFFAVLEAIVRFRVAGSDFFKLLVIVLINASLAMAVGLTIANLFEPGQYLKAIAGTAPPALQNIAFGDLLIQQLPVSVVQPFADNSIMPLVILAVASGFAWRRVGQRQDAGGAAVMARAETLLSVMRELCETLLLWIVRLVPVAVFAASARVTAEHGLHPFAGLGKYVVLCLLGMAIHVAFTYSAWLVLFVRKALHAFWRRALEPVLYAFSVNSSLVALPLTLRALDDLGVSRRASTLAACVGTNLNNDGIILYEGFTLLALAQAAGLELSLAAQLVAASYCIIAAMGVAGVPEAGVVALTLVLGGLGLPAEALAMLLSVDWIIARARSLLNTTSDMVGSTVLDCWLRRSGEAPEGLSSEPTGAAAAPYAPQSPDDQRGIP